MMVEGEIVRIGEGSRVEDVVRGADFSEGEKVHDSICEDNFMMIKTVRLDNPNLIESRCYAINVIQKTLGCASDICSRSYIGRGDTVNFLEKEATLEGTF